MAKRRTPAAIAPLAAECDNIVGSLHEGLFRLSDLIERLRPPVVGDHGTDAMPTACLSPARPRRDRAVLIDKTLKVLEFAWGTGILDLSVQEYADVLHTLFPDKFCDDRAVKARIAEVRTQKLSLFRQQREDD